MPKSLITILTGLLFLYSINSFTQDTVTLTLAVNDASWGTTDPTPGAHEVNANEAIAIQAIAADGYEFSKWTGGSHADIADENAASTTATLSKNSTVTAVFTENGSTTAVLTMAVNDSSFGTTDPVLGDHTFNIGETVNITANPAEGYVFSQWTGGNNVVITDSTSAVTTAVLSKSATVTAVFSQATATAVLTVSLSPVNAGTTDPSPGTYTYNTGEKINISATAADGYEFLCWNSSDGATVQQPTNTTTTVTLSQDGSIEAVFVPSNYQGLNIDAITICVNNAKNNADKIIFKNGIIPDGFPTLTEDSTVTVFVGGYTEDCTDFEINADKGKYESSFEKSDGTKVTLKFDTVKGTWCFKAVKANAFDSLNFNVDEETLKTEVFIYISVDNQNYGATFEFDEKTSWKYTGIEDLEETLNIEKASGKFTTNTDISAADKKDSFKINKGTLGGLTITQSMFNQVEVSISIDNLEYDAVFQLEQPNTDKEVYKGEADTASGTVKMSLKQKENNFYLSLKVSKADGSLIKGPDINIKIDIGTVYKGRYKATMSQKTTLKYKKS